MSQKSIDNIIMIGMMRIRKMKTRVCQTGKLQCTLPEVILQEAPNASTGLCNASVMLCCRNSEGKTNVFRKCRVGLPDA